MCCLRYEHETYEEAIARTPGCGSTVMTEDGRGVVVETKPLAALIKVRLTDKEKDTTKIYEVDKVKVLSRPGKKDKVEDEGEGAEE